MNKYQKIILCVGGVIVAICFFGIANRPRDFIELLSFSVGVSIITLLIIFIIPNKKSTDTVKKIAVGLAIMFSLVSVLGLSYSAADAADDAYRECSSAESDCSNAYSECDSAEDACSSMSYR